MRLKLTLERAGGVASDVTVTVGPHTTMHEIARALEGADAVVAHTSGGDNLSVRLHSPTGRSVLLDPTVPVSSSGIASGARISLAVASTRELERDARPPAGIVRVVSGPDAGSEFALTVGSTVIGRGADARVRLTDPLVSKAHVRVNVGDSIELIDLGSANGTLVNDTAVSRTVLSPGDRVALGDSVITVAAAAEAAAYDIGGVVELNRSPRLDPVYPGVTLKAPELPERRQPQHMPLIALVVPVIMGVVLYIVAPSPAVIAFVALSPLLLVASYLDGLIHARRDWKREVAEFEKGMTALDDELAREQDVQRAARLHESPSVADVVESVRTRGPLLWTRRPEHGAFLSVRLGIGRMPSRSTIELPGQRRGVPEFWSRLAEQADRAAVIDEVPVAERISDSGNLGVSGPLEAARAVARGLVLQFVGLHSPAEVVLAGVASTASSPAWDWLKWLPHVGSMHSPLSVPHLAADGTAINGLLSEVEDLIARRRAGRSATDAELALPAVILVVEDDAPVERARLIEIAESGPDVSVHLLWVSPSLSRLPAACRTFVDINVVAASSLAGYVRTGWGVHPVVCEPVELTDADAIARDLSPVVDAGARVSDSSDLPRQVSLLTLLGPEVADEADEVIERWQQTASIISGPRAVSDAALKRASLRAVFGQAATEPFSIDLRTDGPHALVGGTTGAGKSEFLQAWVLGMASAHSPQRVTFLFVDYKGGAAFAECVALPHSVGLVTDLNQHLVRRALTSLRAELTFREHLLNRKKVKDLIELERTGDPETPPSLVIIVDEFAALVSEVPEFVDGVVDVAQRGRSLGLHLVLATQRPAGVIKDNLRANTNLRIALRMADEENSADVLGTSEAAFFDPAIPGRGAAKTGPGRIRSFQTGYAGGWTGDTPARGQVTIEDLRFGPPVEWEQSVDPTELARVEQLTSGPTDIKRLVRTISTASRRAEIGAPRRPWLPTMSEIYDIGKLPTKRTDEALVFAVVDRPAQQDQDVAAFNPDRDGNMAVLGTGGAGKTTALRAIASAAANTLRGGPVHVYGLDFAGGGLRMLESLPHVGSIVLGDDEERLGRLLRTLSATIDERSALFADARASTIVEYRKLAKRPDLPRIVLLLDGMGAFRDAYESAFTVPWFEVLSRIATDGRQVGVHLVVTGDRAGAIPTSLTASIQRQLVLRLSNADEYGVLGVPSDILSPSSPPGRGILDGLEVQVAVRGGDTNVSVQAHALDELAEAMREAGVVPAPAVERLTDFVPLDDLPTTVGGLPTLGLADATLAPIGFDLTGGFIVSGPPGAGRTTAIATIASSIARAQPGLRMVFLSSRPSRVARLSIWSEVAEGSAALESTIERLAEEIDGATGAPRLVLVMEDLGELAEDPGAVELEALIRRALRADHVVVGSSESSTWGQAYTLGQLLRASRRGLLLQPDDGDGEQLLNTETGRVRRGTMPPGRGFLVAGGRSAVVQVAVAVDD